MVQGRVSRAAGELDPRTRTMAVEVDLDNADRAIVAGSFVTVRLTVPGPPRLRLPVEALVLRQQKPFVALVTPEGRVSLRSVVIAHHDGTQLLLASGVAEGDRVALDVGRTLDDGAVVPAVQAAPPWAPARRGEYYGLPDISVDRNKWIMTALLVLVAVAAGLACASVGGGAYEFLVVDPFWPGRLDLIQPARGGLSRRRFWIPAHSTFELALVASLVVAWGLPAVRTPLVVALASHATMRIWSFVDFIPKALAFERADPATFDAAAARRWRRRSLGRLPLDLVTCGAMVVALVAGARGG